MLRLHGQIVFPLQEDAFAVHCCYAYLQQDRLFKTQLAMITRAVQQERDEALVCVCSDAVGALPQLAELSALQRVMLGVIKHGVVLWAANICLLHAAQQIRDLCFSQEYCCPAHAVHSEFIQRLSTQGNGKLHSHVKDLPSIMHQIVRKSGAA